MIAGITNEYRPQRDGKIRSGRKVGDKLENLPHFLLHDAPQLIPALGEHPTEIYFTVAPRMNPEPPTNFTEMVNHFYRDDLRYYSASEQICRSLHHHIGPTGKDMGLVAAYFKVGQEAAGLRKEPFPGVARAFVRNCAYKSCPDYVQKKCKEHMFLDIIVPQFSMMSMFTLDSVSIKAILNTLGTFQKSATAYRGIFEGQIFRLFKDKGDIPYLDKNGVRRQRETDLVYTENIKFSDYEAQFRDKISPEDWDTLMYIRGTAQSKREVITTRAAVAAYIAPPIAEDDVEQLPAAPQAALTGLAQSAEETTADAHKIRGNDPAAAKYFEEIAALSGKENSEDMRTATAKHFAGVQELVDYLKNRIQEAKKAKKGPATKVAAPPANSVPTTATSGAPPPGDPLTTPSLF